MPQSVSQLSVLLLRLQAGDVAARQGIIHSAITRLETLARRMFRQFPRLRSLEQTPDILQNSLIRLDRALHSVIPNSSEEFFALAAEQIRRVLLDLTKHYARHRVRIVHHLEQKTCLDSFVDDMSLDTESLERWTALHSAVDKLPSPVRAVFDLHFYRGINKAEIAEILGVNVQTVYRRWQVAVDALNEELGGDIPTW